ncbi:MAG: hypothetical protein ACKVOE_10275 [Rickettsiales bacterium]
MRVLDELMVMQAEFKKARDAVRRNLVALMQPLMVGELKESSDNVEAQLGENQPLWDKAHAFSEDIVALAQRWLNLPDFDASDAETLKAMQIHRMQRFARKELGGNESLASQILVVFPFVDKVAALAELRVKSYFVPLTMQERDLNRGLQTSISANLQALAQEPGDVPLGSHQVALMLEAFTANIDGVVMRQFRNVVTH